MTAATPTRPIIKIRVGKYHLPMWKALHHNITARVWAPNEDRKEWAASWDNLDDEFEGNFSRADSLAQVLQNVFTEDMQGNPLTGDKLALGRAFARAFIKAIQKETHTR